MGILDEIGNTPLVRLERCVPANGAELWLKLEYRNPSGSMKDRMALAMIEGAEHDGLIGPGTTVVEYSGGSTGPALALICSLKGYRCIIVIADSHTEERLQLMRALGAELEVVPSVHGRPRVTAEDVRRMVERAGELAALPGHYATDQFRNPYVVPGFRDGLGQEIWEQTDGRVTAFCQGVGTGTSVMGIARALKPHGVYISALEPAGSAALSGGPTGTFATQGWTGLIPPQWDPEWVDEVQQIEDHEAIEMTRRLSREEGIFAGITTGANVVGALRLAERLGPDSIIVTLAVDTGFKYMSVAPYGEPPYATGIVGREEELAAIDAFLTSVPAGPQALVLEGEPGMGTTTLLQAAVRGARERSYSILECRPTRADVSRSFSALAELLEPALTTESSFLPPPQRRALEIALRRRPAEAPPPTERALGLAVAGVLRHLARSQPVVVAIDDVEALDESSAAALTFALRCLETEPVSVVSAVSPDGVATLQLERFVRQPVGPLSLGALHRLLQDRLETTFPRREIVRTHRTSEGNPLHALELARARVALSDEDDAPLAAPGVGELLRERVAALPADVQLLLLEVAARSEPRMDSPTLARLRPAVEAGVVELDGDRVRFTHPLLAVAVYDHAEPELRRQIHAQLAEALPDVEERARHLALVTESVSTKAATALEQAARHVQSLGAPAPAAELAELAARTTPEGDLASVGRRLLAAELLLRAGRTPPARVLAGELVGELGPGRERAAARRLLAAASLDDLEAASELCTRALVDAEDDQVLRAELNLELAMLWLDRGDLTRALAHARAARVSAEPVGEARLLVRVLSTVALLNSLASGPLDERALDLALELERETERPAGPYGPRTVLGVRSMLAGHLDEARTAFEDDEAAAFAAGDRAGRAQALACLAELELRAGRWQDGLRHARTGLTLAEESGPPQLEASLLAAVARVSAHLGEVEQARAAASRGAERAGAMKATLARLQNVAALGFTELSRRPQEADRLLRPLLADRDGVGLAGPAASRVLADAIEAMVESGAVEEALVHVDALDSRAHEHPSPWARAAAHRVRGLWLAASGLLDEAEVELRTAVSEHEAAGEPFELGRAQLILGRTLRRMKQKRAARETLGAALALFDELGATDWAQSARDELGRIAGRRPAQNGLTPTELRVAALVTEGQSNKEVAAALHVTVKTVEGTLSRIYAKVGVRSRTALARHLGSFEEE